MWEGLVLCWEGQIIGNGTILYNYSHVLVILSTSELKPSTTQPGRSSVGYQEGLWIIFAGTCPDPTTEVEKHTKYVE